MSQAHTNIPQVPEQCVNYLALEDDYETLEISIDCANQLIVDLEDLLRECLPSAPEDVRLRAEELLNR